MADAVENGLQGIIDRMKAEGQLTRNSGTNSIKVTNQTLKTVNSTLDGLRDMFKEFFEAQRTDALSNTLNDNVSPTTLPTGDGADAGDTVKETNNSLVALGLLGTAFSATVGTFIGVIRGQIQAIRTSLKFISPTMFDVVADGFRLAKGSILTAIDTLKGGLLTIFDTSKAAIASGFDNILQAIKPVDGGRLSTIFSGISTRLASFGDIFGGIGETFSKTIEAAKNSKVAGYIDDLTSYIKSVGSSIGNIAKTVGKIFAPIAVVMTLFDTYKATVEGYTEEGVWGAIKGGITGFFNSLIFAPLDLIKNAGAWILGKLGFDETAEAVSSFSFQELFTDLMGGLFGFAESAVQWVKDMFVWGGDIAVAGFTTLSAWVSDVWGKAVKWVTGAFDFASENITNAGFTLFSFADGVIGDAVAAIKGIFAGDFSLENFTNLFGSIFDIIYAPINLAVNAIGSMFGFTDPENPFRLSTFISDVFDDVVGWFKEKFSGLTDLLPSIESIKTAIISGLPSWMVPDSFKTPEMRAQDIRNMIAEEKDMISRSEAGENVYYGRESRGREKSLQEIERLRLELAEMERQKGNQGAVIVNNTTAASGGNSSAQNANIYLGGKMGEFGLRPDVSGGF